MGRVVLGARVTDSQAAALRAYAEQAGLTFYQATIRAVEIGIASLAEERQTDDASPSTDTPPDPELVALRETVDRLALRAELADRVIQRSLYTSCASYAAALAGPGHGEEHMAQIARDADRIFERQLAKAREG